MLVEGWLFWWHADISLRLPRVTQSARPAEVDNLVLLTRDEADAHDALASLAELRAKEPAFFHEVETKTRRARRDNGFTEGDHSW